MYQMTVSGRECVSINYEWDQSVCQLTVSETRECGSVD